jgi:hypothetical protein
MHRVMYPSFFMLNEIRVKNCSVLNKLTQFI